MAIIEVEGLSKQYGQVQALRGISFSVEKGEVIGLLGPNGAGKTTTMKILAGFIQPTEGSARIAGYDVVEDPRAVQAVLGYLPENAPLYQDMAVQEYLQMMADLRGIPPGQFQALVSDAVYSTGLQDRLTTPISELSKGFRQRVGLASAILHQPKLLILDEPTNGLDPNQIVEIRKLIARLAKNATVIVSTHILSEVEATCDRAIIIIDGEIRANARLDELTTSSSAIVGVVGDNAADAVSSLEAINGVARVTPETDIRGVKRYRVVGEKNLDLCPMIFDIAKEKGFRLAELQQETRTLESVFRELASQQGVAA
ncbi:MAG: ABC transporter ATP-binding protein [Myxococcales bacterium]|nr:ABC transporter ATP-binding protein [Myxococcales bacterium]